MPEDPKRLKLSITIENAEEEENFILNEVSRRLTEQFQERVMLELRSRTNALFHLHATAFGPDLVPDLFRKWLASPVTETIAPGIEETITNEERILRRFTHYLAQPIRPGRVRGDAIFSVWLGEQSVSLFEGMTRAQAEFLQARLAGFIAKLPPGPTCPRTGESCGCEPQSARRKLCLGQVTQP